MHQKKKPTVFTAGSLEDSLNSGLRKSPSRRMVAMMQMGVH
jgi:hypothetical protein